MAAKAKAQKIIDENAVGKRVVSDVVIVVVLAILTSP